MGAVRRKEIALPMIEIEFSVPLRKKNNPGGDHEASIKIVNGVPQSEEDGIPVFCLNRYDLEKKTIVFKSWWTFVGPEELREPYASLGFGVFDPTSGFPTYFSKKVVAKVRDLESGVQLYPKP